MAWALVGTIGAVSQGAASAAVTPNWGTNENRVAGNLLVLFVAGTANASLPAAISGWSIAIQKAGTSCSASIYYTIAQGADAAPTVAAVTNVVLSCQLAEFSGGLWASPLDKTATAAGTTSAQVATAAGADIRSDSLLIACAGTYYSSGNTKTTNHTFNNGAASNKTSNDATSTQQHYNFTWGITNTKASASRTSYAFTTTFVTGTAVALASFTVNLPNSFENYKFADVGGAGIMSVTEKIR